MSIPDRLGRYEVRGVIGSGAMGTVYFAWDPELNRDVAIKILRQPYLADEALLRFRREAQALARLPHPNIVAVHDVGADTGAPYIVMELVVGSTLAAEIATQRQRPLAAKVELMAQLCDALDLAHRSGIIHRDVKPGNILITPEGVAKLADFGLARLQSSSLTAAELVVGTPGYIAPEVFAGHELDARADIYGVAASLFEWVCGSRPHTAEHPAALMAQVLNDDAPDIRTRWPGSPAELAECLRRALSRVRDHRPSSAAEFAATLRSLRNLDGVSSDSTVILRPTAAVPSRRQQQWSFAVAGAVVVAGVMVLLVARQRTGAPIPVLPSSPAAPVQISSTDRIRQMATDILSVTSVTQNGDTLTIRARSITPAGLTNFVNQIEGLDDVVGPVQVVDRVAEDPNSASSNILFTIRATLRNGAAAGATRLWLSWGFGGGADSNAAADISGHRRDGRINAAEIVAGRSGRRALQFGGGPPGSQYVLLETGAEPLPQRLVVEFGMRPDRLDIDNQMLVHKYDNGMPSNSDVIVYLSDRELNFATRGGERLTTTLPAPNRWYDVIAVADGDGSQLWVDGVLRAQGYLSPIAQGNRPLVVGSCVGTCAANNRTFAGAIDGLMIAERIARP